MARQAPFSVRLLDAEFDLEIGHALAFESRGEFTRKAIRERAERFRRELLAPRRQAEDSSTRGSEPGD